MRVNSKLEQAEIYIRNMKIGQRVSIKKLAREVSVSEGTAYHAIKNAETQGLVVTLPKVGTTRVQAAPKVKDYDVTVGILKKLIGARVLTGEADDGRIFSSFCVGDGSADAFLSALEKSSRRGIGILGDRPDLQAEAIKHSYPLLLTDDAGLSPELMDLALQQQCLVMQTRHSTPHVMNLLSRDSELNFPAAEELTVREWMQPPRFMYLNDLVIDGNDIYESCLIPDIPVVDESMHICGKLPVSKLHIYDPTQRVKNIFEPGNSFRTMEEEELLSEAATYILSGTNREVLIVKDGVLTGMLTHMDILKFYQYYFFSRSMERLACFFEPLDAKSGEKMQIYSIRSSFFNAEESLHYGNRLIAVLTSAVEFYCKNKNMHGKIQNMTSFLRKDVPPHTELYLSVEPVNEGGSVCMIECTLYSDPDIYVVADYMIGI